MLLRSRASVVYNKEEHGSTLVSFGLVTLDGFTEEDIVSDKWKNLGFQGNGERDTWRRREH